VIFEVLTLFPAMFATPMEESILGRAVHRQLLEFQVYNLRDWAEGKHLQADDSPYGGGDGMVMKPEPVSRALSALKAKTPRSRVLLMTPQGQQFHQGHARRLAQEEGLIFLCGRYAGFDERIRQSMVDEEFSIGDYVLTGGELPAMVMIDAISRHLPGVLGNTNSVGTDSFADGLLEFPQYTRPADFQGMKVPDVLLSGDHGQIAKWRREQQLARTLQRRPDLLETAKLSKQDLEMIDQLRRDAQ
jgi:tRNA (guanine37-N1)-methyltransferase